MFAESRLMPCISPLAKSGATEGRREDGARRVPETLPGGRPMVEPTQLVPNDVQPVDHPRAAVLPSRWQ